MTVGVSVRDTEYSQIFYSRNVLHRFFSLCPYLLLHCNFTSHTTSTFLLASLPPGRRVWRYSSSGVDPGFPLRSSELGLPGHPDQAFYYPRLGHLVVFKGQLYFVLNLGTLRPEPYYPRSLDDWRGVPRGTNGAISHPDGQVYFFKERHYWRFDPEKVQVTGEGMWDTELEWTGCLGTHHRGNNIL